jgi:hypothetical protein
MLSISPWNRQRIDIPFLKGRNGKEKDFKILSKAET